MYVLVTYDIETTSASGARRLRRVAQVCLNYGQRVQNSVFECDISEVQLVELTHQLEKLIDAKKDSVRIYKLPEKAKSKVIHMGIKEPINFRDPLIL